MPIYTIQFLFGWILDIKLQSLQHNSMSPNMKKKPAMIFNNVMFVLIDSYFYSLVCLCSPYFPLDVFVLSVCAMFFDFSSFFFFFSVIALFGDRYLLILLAWPISLAISKAAVSPSVNNTTQWAMFAPCRSDLVPIMKVIKLHCSCQTLEISNIIISPHSRNLHIVVNNAL